MIFSSIFFLFIFLPITLLLYYIVPWKFKNAVLLLFSLVFYAWGAPVYIFLMLFSIVFNYFSGIEIDYYHKKRDRKSKKISFWFTVTVNSKPGNSWIFQILRISYIKSERSSAIRNPI